MQEHRLRSILELPIIAVIFLLFSYLLTFSIISLPYVVIGDNFAWTAPNIVDILGPKVIRESYLGDIAVLSTFKTGFLFPLSYLFNSLNLPTTLIYPFLFYFFSMLSFYALSSEFLKRRFLRIIASVIYVVNPVTPYYYYSILSAFVIVFLPLVLVFFVRTLRQINLRHDLSPFFSGNFALCSLFLALSISAHEQFLPSMSVVSVILILVFIAACYLKYGLSKVFGKTVAINVLALAAIVLLVNTQEVLTLINVVNSPFAAYFTGRFQDFLVNVNYTYSTTNLLTLFRLGGDSGAGLMQNAWFDTWTPTNLFGYALFVALLVSVLLLVRRKDSSDVDRPYFYATVLIFASALILIFFVKYLPSNPALAEELFNMALLSWETPAKLRVLLLLSGLATSLFAFRELENYGKTKRRKIVAAALICFFVASVVIYNSPWVIGYPGFTPAQQISETQNWGGLYSKQYSELSDLLGKNYTDCRGVVIPYTHRDELYAPPNFRLFQLFSPVNEKTHALTLSSSSSWSKLLGLLSAKYVVLKEDYTPDEWLLFPKPPDNNMSGFINEIRDDPALNYVERFANWTILTNENALPKAYATRYYTLYDDVGTLKYAFDSIDFKSLPVFIGSEDQIGRLIVPSFVRSDDYEIYALSQSNVSGSSLPLTVTNGNSSVTLNLQRTGSSGSVDWYSSSYRPSAGDIVALLNSDGSSLERKISELTLNSTSFNLGTYNNFVLNFTVSVLQKGEYSVQGPRVLIDAGNSTRYLVMFHDDGITELGILKGNAFASGVMINQELYNLKSPENSIDVDISKVFDEVRVSVNGNLVFSFLVDANASTVSLSSDSSVSKFTDVELATRNVARIFAVRQFKSQPDFSVRQCNAEQTTLEISSNDPSDYAIVVQYLDTPQRVLENEATATPFRANVFFNGWVLNSVDTNSTKILAIRVANLNLALGLVSFSILFTWTVLAVGLVALKRKKPVQFSALLTRLRRLRHSAIFRGGKKVA